MVLRQFIGLLIVFALTIGLIGCSQTPSPSISPTEEQKPSKPVTASKEQYQVTLSVKEPPLTIGEEKLTVTVEDIKVHEPVTELPEFKAVMVMPDHTMEAPLEVTQLPVPGEYELKPVFTMAGKWTIEVKPVQSDVTVSISLDVQDAEGEKGAE